MKKIKMFLSLALMVSSMSVFAADNQQSKWGIKEFFKQAFADMVADFRAQAELDKANLAAIKAESKLQFEQAKRSPKQVHEDRQAKIAQQIIEAKQREADAKEQLNNAE